MTEKTKVLFVCLGNIVRSPLAEHMFRHLVEQAGLAEKYEIDSAGTSGYHIGESPDRRMRQVAAENGLVYNGRARQFRPEDFERFDLIVGMDSSNRDHLLRMGRGLEQQAKVRMMREFDPDAPPNAPVPDPYYGGMDGFTNAFKLVEKACAGLLKSLEAGELDS